MGVFCDYFRAPDTASVAELMVRTDGDTPLDVHNGQIDGVDAEGIDPAVALGKIVALILGREWEPGLVPARPVWQEDLECHEGPWVLDVGDVALHALAGLDVTRIPALIRSLPNTDPQWLAETLESLAALARRTTASGRRLYCWVSM